MKTKRTGPTNIYLKEIIQKLRKLGHEKNIPIWLTVAEKLEKPRRKRIEVNLSRIERYVKEGETIVVPGIVLGSGNLTKKIKVAAWRFSNSAREKIEKAGGECLSIDELVEKNPKGSGVRIIC